MDDTCEPAHTYCRRCITAWLETSDDPTCPSTRSPLDAAELKTTNVIVKTLCEKFRVQCIARGETGTCDWTGLSAAIPNHVQTCAQRLRTEHLPLSTWFDSRIRFGMSATELNTFLSAHYMHLNISAGLPTASEVKNFTSTYLYFGPTTHNKTLGEYATVLLSPAFTSVLPGWLIDLDGGYFQYIFHCCDDNTRLHAISVRVYRYRHRQDLGSEYLRKFVRAFGVEGGCRVLGPGDGVGEWSLSEDTRGFHAMGKDVIVKGWADGDWVNYDFVDPQNVMLNGIGYELRC
ncbi:hypothetical protein HDV00_008752 [Rhizophlyctis rosea]|nr:hypothetical protein HDV00_008752 [Rhizophlyctis rosea]